MGKSDLTKSGDRGVFGSGDGLWELSKKNQNNTMRGDRPRTNVFHQNWRLGSRSFSETESLRTSSHFMTKSPRYLLFFEKLAFASFSATSWNGPTLPKPVCRAPPAPHSPPALAFLGWRRAARERPTSNLFGWGAVHKGFADNMGSAGGGAAWGGREGSGEVVKRVWELAEWGEAVGVWGSFKSTYERCYGSSPNHIMQILGF